MLRPAKILVIVLATLPVGCAIFFLGRHNNYIDWTVGTSLLIGGMVIVVNRFWLQYVAITNDVLIRVEWFGLHRRTLPIAEIEVRTRPRDTSFRVVRPVLEVRFVTPSSVVKLNPDFYWDRSAKEALGLLRQRGVHVALELLKNYKIPA